MRTIKTKGYRDEVALVGSNERPNQIRFADLKPYAIVESLDDLNGADHGTVDLPQRILWAPGKKRKNIDFYGQRKVVYRSVLSEGTLEDVRRYLNKGLLIELWGDLSLPSHVARAWEDRFPELRGNPRA